MSEHNHEPVDYTGFRITSLWAFTQIGEDDQEGIVAIYNTKMAMTLPLISSDRVRLDDWRVLAQRTANSTGRDVKLSRFDVRVDLATMTPAKEVNP